MDEKLTRWFRDRTYNHLEFADIGRLVELKREQGLTVSVCLPTLNVVQTVGEMIRVFRTELVEKHPLIDQLAIVDSRSTDGTVEAARAEGAEVIFDDEILPEMPPASGKGEALWKSLYALTGDIIAWVDSDIENVHPRFVYGLVGPLLREAEVDYVKAFYERPLKEGEALKTGGGGRVTELTVRPMLNLFYPELSGLIQPLSGEYAGRRWVLESVPFLTGYGVESGLLIDILRRFGLGSLAQVDLELRVHHNQALSSLSRMSFGILQALFRKLEEDGLISLETEPGTIYSAPERGDEGYEMVSREIEVVERPPITSIPAYADRPR